MARFQNKQNNRNKSVNRSKKKAEIRKPPPKTVSKRRKTISAPAAPQTPFTEEISPREKLKFETPVPESVSIPGIDPKKDYLSKELPGNYGDNIIYLMVRDSHWIFSYWEIQKGHYDTKLAQMGGSWDEVKTVVRIYDITDKTSPNGYFDIFPQAFVNNWYIQVQPNCSYVVEIGLLHHDGRFLVLARSNEVTTPRDSMSDVLDEEWMGIDFEKMYALSGGFELGKSSLELKQLMEERLAGAITSGSGVGVVSSLASPVKIKKRGFNFWLDCELIIYGGTEPDAKVFFQGKEIKLRPDGTFTLRFALPDGKLVLDTRALSRDGIEERVISPIVERRTKRPAPVLKAGVGK